MIESRPSTVLVVDDNAIIRRLQEAQLEALHVQLVAASGGEEALDLMRSIEPDLVLLDVVMPGLDGFRVCEALKADPATREVPVMVVTALGKDARDRSFAAGADDFMRKPPNTLLLRARALVHLRIRRARVAKDALAAGAVLLATADPELGVSILSALPGETQVLRASTPAEARAAMAQKPVAAILDLGMDDAVGIARDWRAAGSRVSTLLVHHAEDFTVIEEDHPPVDDFLELPASAAEVRHRVRLLLRLASAGD
ncbi:MAG TPA: response regulator [Holophagaceae bacterium]|nr:response regulator [Holophagaceae bacterium]